MSIKQLLLREKELPRLDLIVIVSHVLSTTKERIMTDPDRVLTDDEQARIEALIDRRREAPGLSHRPQGVLLRGVLR